jgi:hypothetical protein
MFIYNTMQTFIGVLGMEPLHMVAPASDDARRTKSFPHELASLLATITAAGIRPRDIVTPAAMRNAFVVVMAMGGSTNVVLHGPEIARAAGFDLWDDVLSQQEFNELSHRLPVLVNMRPFGEYSMVDVDAIGGVAVIVKELLAAGALDGSALTCTGETLAEQIERLDPPDPDGDVVLPVRAPFKATGWLRLLQGNLAPDGGAILKVAGVEGGIVDGRFTGRAQGSRASLAHRRFEGSPNCSPTATSSSSVRGPLAPHASRCLTPRRASPPPCLDITVAHDRWPVRSSVGLTRGTSHLRRSAVRSRSCRMVTPSPSTSTPTGSTASSSTTARPRGSARKPGTTPSPPTAERTRTRRSSPPGCSSGFVPPRPLPSAVRV